MSSDEDIVIVTDRDLRTPSPADTTDDKTRKYSDSSEPLITSVITDEDEGSPVDTNDIMPTEDDVNAVEELEMSITKDEPALAGPSARQIVSIGTENDSYAFTFHEEELNEILSKVPAGWKVCVVSVVGAFRTGKSFLLSWFLRYLESHCTKRGGSPENVDSADEKKWHERVQTLNQHEGSFDWRGGKERNTTGIWMWSDPYFLKRDSGEEIAVLLVDTQGMFDHETTVGLTAAIFGLSTLLSSYQIYNVDKRIQEDNLQQLALFAEYGRMAFEAEEKASAMNAQDKTNEAEDEKEDANAETKSPPSHHPFQKIEFLVRDWQNFDTEDENDLDSMENEMAAYLEHVTADRAASDLKETRKQITSCFEEISCFMMTHPGFAVIKNKYEGDVSSVEPLFMSLLDRYCRRVFNTSGSDNVAARLQPKTVRGRELSAVELGTYIKSYAEMFEQIGANFPEPETMLEATSKANNANAINASTDTYNEMMNEIAGPQANDYHQSEKITAMHREASEKALLSFENMANFGSRSAIGDAREKVLQKIAKDFEVFKSLNDGRNPLLGFETYMLPLLVALVSFILRWFADFTCSSWSETCRASSDILSHIYMVVFFFLAIVASTKAKQISDLFDRVRATANLIMNGKDKRD